MSGPHVSVLGVRGSMAKDLGPEVSDIESEYLPFAHRAVPARRRPHPAFPRQLDRSQRRQTPREIRVLAVKFDRAIEATDPIERLPPHCEVAAVQHRAKA